MTPHTEQATPAPHHAFDHAAAGATPRRVFLLGNPRSRTSVSQTVVSLACNLATMKSTNWYLGHPGTVLLNGPDGITREDARPWARQRVAQHVLDTIGIELPAAFALAQALDLLASHTGAAGWLEKTPMHVLTIPEIEDENPGARFIHLVRDPAGAVTSLLRRARDNPTMFGAQHQSVQANDEALWRTCIRATIATHERPNHLIVHSETFVEDPEAEAARVAAFLDVPYRAPDNPQRVAAADAVTPSERAWKQDAAGPVRRIPHDDDVHLEALDPQTQALWDQARTILGIP